MANERREAGWSRGLLDWREQDGKIPFVRGKALLRRENGGRRPYARGAGHEKARRKTG